MVVLFNLVKYAHNESGLNDLNQIATMLNFENNKPDRYQGSMVLFLTFLLSPAIGFAGLTEFS